MISTCCDAWSHAASVALLSEPPVAVERRAIATQLFYWSVTPRFSLWRASARSSRISNSYFILRRPTPYRRRKPRVWQWLATAVLLNWEYTCCAIMGIVKIQTNLNLNSQFPVVYHWILSTIYRRRVRLLLLIFPANIIFKAYRVYIIYKIAFYHPCCRDFCSSFFSYMSYSYFKYIPNIEQGLLRNLL